MDKQLRRTFLLWHSNGLSAVDICKRHNKDPRSEYIVTTMEVADVLKQLGVKDPHQRIEQKPSVQPDMPKRFINIEESKLQRQRHTMTHKPKLTAAQREFHQIACGFSANGQKLLKAKSETGLKRIIEEHVKRGFVQIGGISSDFDCDGCVYLAVVKKGDFRC